GNVYKPKPPRIVVLFPSRYAKPIRGSQLFHTGLWRLVLPLAAVVPYHIPPGRLVAGLITFGSNDRTLPYTSDHPVLPSHRKPRLSVSFGFTLKSSCTKTPGFLSRAPYSGEFSAFQFWT